VEVLRPHGVVIAREGQQLAVLAAICGRQALGMARRDEGVFRAVPCIPAKMPYERMKYSSDGARIAFRGVKFIIMTKTYLG